MSSLLIGTDELRLVGMLRSGNISRDELLNGVRIARVFSSRSSAEKEAKSWFEIHGNLTRHAHWFKLAVGHLVSYRLKNPKAQFATLVVRLLMAGNFTVLEAEKILDLTREHFAGALELVRLHEEGRISEAEVDLAIQVAYGAESEAEASRLAYGLLYASRPAAVSFTDATLTEFTFCVTCLWNLRTSDYAMRQAVEAIKRALYAKTDQRITVAPTVATFDPTIPQPLVVRTTTELLYFGRPDENGFREVLMTPPDPDEKVLPPRMARILGSGYFAQRGHLDGVVGFKEIKIGYPLVLRPPQPLEGIELWATSPVVSVEALYTL